MILIDANLLLYASFQAFNNHRKAYQWFYDVLQSGESAGIPWESINAFLRLSTNIRVFSEPLSNEQAWSQVQTWLGLNNVWVPVPTEEHGAIMAKLLKDPSIVANLIPDAHLAALAIEHGLTLMSCDSDFARFPNLRWENPLS